MEGFKSYSQPTDLTFGDPTVITGGNGRGKSSIADAIAFAVTGLPFFGERRIDRLHSEDNPDLFIRMRFVDENGTLHELSRTRKSNRMTITYDGCEVRQVDLTDLFGERDVFLSIFNPLYFIEELGNDGKNLLQRYLPALTKEDILAQMAGPAVDALRDEPLLSPEVESRKLRETIRELENNILYLTGQQDMTTAQQQSSKTALRELREKEDALRNEEQSLKSKQFAGVDIAALNDELADLSARYSDLANQRQIPTASDGCILALTQELTARKAAVYTPKYAEATAQVNARIRQLGSQYQQEKEQCSRLKPGYQCPTCRRAVTADELPAMQNAFRTSIKQIVEEGQAERAKLEELQALEKKHGIRSCNFRRTILPNWKKPCRRQRKPLNRMQPVPRHSSFRSGCRLWRQSWSSARSLRRNMTVCLPVVRNCSRSARTSPPLRKPRPQPVIWIAS